MLIGNLPIAGSAPTAVHVENRQRVGEFRSLANALSNGDVPGAQHALELLRRNAPNSLKASSRLWDFGHGSQSGDEFDQLEDALKKGDLEGARAVFALSRREREPDREKDQPVENTEVPQPQSGAAAMPNMLDSNVGISLDTLA